MSLLAQRKRDTLEEKYFAIPHHVPVLFSFSLGKAEELLGFISSSFSHGDTWAHDDQTNFSCKRG